MVLVTYHSRRTSTPTMSWQDEPATLLEILGEWRMHDRHAGNDAAWADQWPVVHAWCSDDGRRQAQGVHRGGNLAACLRQKTCDNGGWNAWMCPYGCHPHCVDFGPEDSELHPRVMREEVLV